MIELILNHKELLNEELYMKLVKVIGCFFSVKDVLLNQNDEKILFIIDMLCKEINSEGNNELKQSINVFCLFYICCNYYSKNNSNNQTIMNIIDKVNTIVSNENTVVSKILLSGIKVILEPCSFVVPISFNG